MFITVSKGSREGGQIQVCGDDAGRVGQYFIKFKNQSISKDIIAFHWERNSNKFVIIWYEK